MTDLVDAAVVGAGPYGLSLAAHLRAREIGFRQFGLPMHTWTAAMPHGMFLKSEGFASNLSDPRGTDTLAAFCHATGRRYGDIGMPVSRETFTAYGQWFQQRQAPDIEEALVTNIARTGGAYELTIEAGEQFRARNVLLATGLQHFAHLPDVVAHLPAELCSHSSAHTDLGHFRGRDVTVLGAGQSALETTTLLHESGADARLVARRPSVVWNGPPKPERSLLERIRKPTAALGAGWGGWFYSTKPNLFRRLPPAERMRRAHTAFGPAGAWWLRPRAEGQFPMLLGHTVLGAEPAGDRVRLRLRTPDGEHGELTTDHVIAATGFRPSVARLTLLDGRLRAELRRLGEAPWVGTDFQSNVPGLFFTGLAVASSFGPVMRFVYGSDYAARVISRRIEARTGRTQPGVVKRPQLTPRLRTAGSLSMHGVVWN